MGSRGIKRRKPKRPLPREPHRHSQDGIGSSAGPPGVMWPSGGFDPSGFSPAGEVLGLSRLAQGVTGMRGRRPPLAATLAAGVVLSFLVLVVVVLLVNVA